MISLPAQAVLFLHVYERQPWTVAVNAKNLDARDRGVAKVQGYQLPSRLKGVPLD